MLTTPLLRASARRAPLLHVAIEPRQAELDLSPAMLPRCAPEDAANCAPPPAATRATLALFSRGGLVDARAFSF